MIRILITGANSYIGTSVEKWLKSGYFEYLTRTANIGRTEKQSDSEVQAGPGEANQQYEILTVETRDHQYCKVDFTGYDTVFHVAGIAHADVSKVTDTEKKQYIDVNCMLAAMVAGKAKESGVKQFIYMSSMIVYGESAPIGKTYEVTPETTPTPVNFYGQSKLMGEEQLLKLQEDSFHIAIVRPPMIYGEGCKGNYPILASLSAKLPVIPRIKNERSMIYIRNFCEFIRLLIDSGEGGVFYPQNEKTVNTSELMLLIARTSGKKRCPTRIFNPAIYIASKLPGRVGRLCNKAFGNMTYQSSMSCHFGGAYRLYGLKESVELTGRLK